jgi:hypothetical protein
LRRDPRIPLDTYARARRPLDAYPWPDSQGDAILKRHVLQYARSNIPACRLHGFRIGQRGVDQARKTFGARFQLSMTLVQFFEHIGL